jgi:probable phosphoglycerate mutase
VQLGTEADVLGGATGTELILIRHGQGICNAGSIIGGERGCRGLSSQGRNDCQALASTLMKIHAQGRQVEVILSSPRPRVKQCAEIIARQLSMRVTEVKDLRGQEFGAADGKPWTQVKRDFRGEPIDFPDRPLADGAETWNAYADRVLETLRDVLDRYDGRRILLVAHGKTVALASALLADEPDPATDAARYIIPHGSMVTWQRNDTAWDRAR